MSALPVRALYLGNDCDREGWAPALHADPTLELHWHDGNETAVAVVARLHPDVVLVDLGWSVHAAVDLCRRIRMLHEVPIVVVGSAANPDLCLVAMELGSADDFVTKPIVARELLARLRVHARRHRGELRPANRTISIGALDVHLRTRTVTVRGGGVDLTDSEYAVVSALAQQPGHAMTRSQLLHVVHGAADVAFDRAIDVLISRIRAKLESDPTRPTLLRTVRGVGYLIAHPAQVMESAA